MSNSFNFEEALKELQAGKDLTGKGGILRISGNKWNKWGQNKCE